MIIVHACLYSDESSALQCIHSIGLAIISILSAVKNVQCESGNPSKQDRELNNQEKCTQIITERNNLSPYESDSHRE